MNQSHGNSLKLPYRQVHLDYHTSEALENIGGDFDPVVFVETLRSAHVNSINLFGRCHHGWLYYQSRRFPDLVHPHLNGRDLLREQLDACRAAGIRTTVYLTVQFDDKVAREHPEWLVMDEEGGLSGPGKFEGCFYRFLAVNTGYEKYVREIVSDVFESFPDIEGVFFDIMMPHICSNPVTVRQMVEQGMDPESRIERKRFGVEVINGFKLRMSELVRSYRPDCAIFYNAGHIGPRHRGMIEAYSHFEVESLGSGKWGYAHFPIVARYVRTLGKPFVGMTGKFHTEWGDFHSFKPQPALEYEIFRIIASGGQCCIGDQLHPTGRICDETYKLIGWVYEQVERLEPWCVDAQPVTELAVLSPESCGFAKPIRSDKELAELHVDGGLSACVRILEEGAFQFDVIDVEAAFENYKLLVLPDSICVDAALAEKLKSFAAQGGRILATFESGLNAERTVFPDGLWPVRLTGRGPTDRTGELAAGKAYQFNDFAEYIIPSERIGASLAKIPHVLYQRAIDVEAVEGAEVLAETRESYFDRAWNHFCSHLQTPASAKPGSPGAVRNEAVLYFRHPLFGIYHKKAPPWVRALVQDGVRELLGRPMVSHNGPQTLSISLNHQAKERRHVLHLLHYVPVRKGQDLEVVDERLSTGAFQLVVRLPARVGSVTDVTQPDRSVAWQQRRDAASGAWEITIASPGVAGHQVIELSHAAYNLMRNPD